MLQGEVRIEGDWVRIDLGDGVLAVPADRVESIQAAPTPQALEEARRARDRLWIAARLDGIDASDAQALYRLVLDARTRGVDADEIADLLGLVLGADPDHAGARGDLGEVRYGSHWITPEHARRLERRDRDDRMRRDGFVPLGGEWVRPEHVDWLEREAGWAALVEALETDLSRTRRSAAARESDLESALSTCRGELGSLEAATASLRSDLSAAESGRADAESEASHLKCELDSVRGSLSTCESAVAQCESALGACESRTGSN